MITYLLFFCTILFSSCNKQEETVSTDFYHGKIVGYLKCPDSEMDNNTLIGIFIILNNKDSLLSFNIPSSIFDLDRYQLENGIGFIDGDSISFNYRRALNDEIKLFDCPPTTMQDPTFYPIENFLQAIITNVNKII